MKPCIFLFLFFFLRPVSLPAQGWSELPVSGTVPGLENAGEAFDQANNRLIIFGGRSASGLSDKVFTLDLNSNTWTEVLPKSAPVPAPRHNAEAFYDSENDRLLVWSGQGTELYNDIWAFSFSDSTWEVLSADGNVAGVPLKRYGVAGVFDPLQKRIVTFAGFTTSGRFEDTWYFDTDSLRWTDVSNSVFPLKRCLHAGVYAEDLDAMFIFGGQSSGNRNDLWKLDLQAFDWEQMPVSSLPAARHFTSASYVKGSILVFGGNSASQGNNSGVLNDMWGYDLAAQQWDSLDQGSVVPSARAGHVAVYDEASDRYLVFGGIGADNARNNETWVFQNVSMVLGASPAKGINSALIYPNPAQDRVFVKLPSDPGDGTTIRVFEYTGRLLKEIPASGKETAFDLSGYPAGIYFLLVNSGDVGQGEYVVKK